MAIEFGLHQIIVTDICDLKDRPKLDFFEEERKIFIISKMLSIENENDLEIDEEIVYFLLDAETNTLITFQQGRPGDVWADVRKRLSRPTSKVRQSETDYLLFCLLDALLETCYPIVENYGTLMENIEFKLLKNATPSLNRQVYHLKQELLFLRHSVWPLRDAVMQIISEDMPGDMIAEGTKHFFRSTHDRLLQVNDMVESYVELAASLAGVYTDQQAQKMNNIVFALTLVSAIFIPLTFIAGVYGMNFEYMPELQWEYGYLYVHLLFLSTAAFIIFMFWMKGWVGGRHSPSDETSPV
eukprot:TRINITY_DN7503_c0_g2_i1.p1 TRINITY_DN7503_c0_g2~~TRINITY_DN7503_c0_g2_i1.p1  ORF type:complete len:298 (-),score=71.74 TRINITY_DN7503_c0_g2_i1:491-1384(-)